MSDDIKARIAALEATCTELAAQLAEARTHVAPTMKKQLRCPACRATRIAHATEVLDRDGGDTEPLALSDLSIWSSKVVGVLEAFACTACGYVEWYVKDPGSLRETKTIVIVDAESKQAGPYR